MSKLAAAAARSENEKRSKSSEQLRVTRVRESFGYYVPERKTALVRYKQCRGWNREVVGNKS